MQFMDSNQFNAVRDAIMQALEEAADELGGEVDPVTENAIDKALVPFIVVKKTPTRNAELCNKGLDAAEKFLKMRGYEIVEREWSCYAGEIDFIAKDEGTLVFVEVKTRNMTDKGLPDEAITEEKRRRFENIAASYMAEHEEIDECSMRFDIIGILVTSEHRAMIRHHINAFS